MRFIVLAFPQRFAVSQVSRGRGGGWFAYPSECGPGRALPDLKGDSWGCSFVSQIASLFGSMANPQVPLFGTRRLPVRVVDPAFAGGSVLHFEIEDRKSSSCTWGCTRRLAGYARL